MFSVRDLAFCGISTVDVESGALKACFEGIGEDNIHILYLGRNDLTTLTSGMFDSLEALTTL